MPNINASIAEQLSYLEETKKQLKAVLSDKGQVISDEVPFRNYVDNINNLGAAQLFNNYDEMNISNIKTEGSIGIIYDVANANFQGIFKYNKDKFEVAPTQLTAQDSDVMGIPYFGANGVSTGTFNSNKYFTDANISDLTAYEKTFDSFYDTLDTTNISNWHSFYYKTKIKHQKPRYINIQGTNNAMYAFENASNIFEFPSSNTWDLSNLEKATSMFINCYNLRNMNTTNWNLSNLKQATRMFYSCTNLNLNSYVTSTWNCINLVNAQEMFMYSNISGAVLTNWINLANTTNMFRSCYNMNCAYMAGNYINLINTDNMFANCVNLGYGVNMMSLTNLNMPAVNNASNMFANCVSLDTNFNNWNFPNLKDASTMLYNCQNLKGSKQIINFEAKMPNLKNTSMMFYNCRNITGFTHTARYLNINNVTNTNNMFFNCVNLSSFKYSSYDVQFSMPNLVQAINMFSGCMNFAPNVNWYMPKLTTPQIIMNSGITNIIMDNTSNLDALTTFISTINCPRLTDININGTNFASLKNISIKGASNLKNITIKNINCNTGINAISFISLPNLENLTVTNILYANQVSLANFLYECNLITSFNMSDWNIPNIVGMYSGFYKCANLQTINMGGADLSTLTSLSNAFQYLPNVTEINLTGTNMCNVKRIDNAFIALPKLTELDLSSLDGSKISSTFQAFFECHNLQTINLPYFSNLTYGNNMFANCYSLDINCAYGKFDMNNIFTVEDMFYRNFNIYNLDLRQLMGETCTRANMSFMFRTCTNLRNISFANMNLPNLGGLHYTFYWAGPVETVDFTNCNLPNLSSMAYTFGFSNMVDCTINNLNAPNLTSMNQTFFNCHSLQNITFYNFSAPKLTYTNNCFGNHLSSIRRVSFINANLASLRDPGAFCTNCSHISHVNFHGTNFANAYTLTPDYGWYSSSNLHYLDYSDCYTPNLTSLGIQYRTSSGTKTFYALTDYNIANINTTKVTSLVNTFYYANKLLNIDFTNCNFCNVTNTYGMFYRCNNLTDASVDQIINAVLTMVNMPVKNLHVSNTSSPFMGSNITSTRYSNRLAELDAAGWTY